MSDALTFAFANATGDACGVARLGRSGDTASGLAILFRGGDEAIVRADGEGRAAERWDDLRAAGLATETLEPGVRWRVTSEGDAPLDLEFEAVGAPLELAGDSPVGQAGGMHGSDQVCRVTGTVGGEPFEGRGQRGESSGEPDWDRMALARTLTAWFDDDHALSGVSVQPAKAKSHGDEAIAIHVVEEHPALATEARISTTYDADERQRSVGLELWLDEEDPFPRRAAGEVLAGTSLDLGRLRLDCAFFRWRMGGREGVGRYDILRRTA